MQENEITYKIRGAIFKNKHIGILVNFDTEDINNSIYRKINGYTPQTNETTEQ